MVKFLYASFVSNSAQMSGILKKVAGQTKGVASLGYEAHYTCIEEDEVALYTPQGVERKSIAKGLRWRKRQQAIAACVESFIEEGRYDIIYIKGFLISRYHHHVARAAKRARRDTTVIFEVATYPYWGEYHRLFAMDRKNRDLRALRGHLLEVIQHAVSSLSIHRCVDAVVAFGTPVERLWGIPALVVDNGVDVESIHLRRPKFESANIKLIGVAGSSIAHGFSRVLQSMETYYANGGDREFQFSIVGNNDTITELKTIAQSPNLQCRVSFLGYQNAEQLTNLYDVHDIAVSSIGVYLLGLTHLSPLKSREYCAAGIPFLYGYSDQLLDGGTSFTMRVSNDASLISMDEIADFVDRCRADADLPQKERAFAIEHYDWRVIMQQVLQFAESQQKR